MLKAILEKAGIKTGIIGTVKQGFEGHYREAEITGEENLEEDSRHTPEYILQRLSSLK